MRPYFLYVIIGHYFHRSPFDQSDCFFFFICFFFFFFFFEHWRQFCQEIGKKWQLVAYCNSFLFTEKRSLLKSMTLRFCFHWFVLTFDIIYHSLFNQLSLCFHSLRLSLVFFLLFCFSFFHVFFFFRLLNRRRWVFVYIIWWMNFESQHRGL